MKSNFYALLARMKFINRWGLMRSTHNETLSEHCLDTAFIAHALVIIDNKRFGGTLNPDRAAVLAMYHDVSEILTGDMPTPVKYFNPDIRKAYKAAEQSACERLLAGLPDDMRAEIEPCVIYDEDAKRYELFIKAADKLSALAKCIEERGMGNREFEDAEISTKEAIKALKLPAADVFLDNFMQAYGSTLDKLSR